MRKIISICCRYQSRVGQAKRRPTNIRENTWWVGASLDPPYFLGWKNVCLCVPILLLLFLAGCNSSNSNRPETNKNDDIPPAISTVENGPVKLTAEIKPAKARLSDEPVLTLTIDCDRGVEIDKPPFGEELGNFKIIDSRESLPKTREGREIYERFLTLEPTATGRFAIDPINVTFHDKRPGADGKPQSLATKPLTVEITSVYTKETPSLGDLQAEAGPMELPWKVPLWGWAILVGLVIAVIAAIAIWRKRKREKAAEAIVLSPEELARMELQKLLDSGWMETDVKLYFVELTAIVRRYIERTTGIHAPEQTTEEFLREISRSSSPRPLGEGSGVRAGMTVGSCLGPHPNPLPIGEGYYNNRLKEFLESADLVKFAAHRPRREDIQESFRRAEVFIALKPQESAMQPEEAMR